MTANDVPAVLHVIVRAGPTNSQYNEHCLPVLGERRITVASLFPAEVEPPRQLRLVEGDGSFRGSLRAIRTALDLGPFDVVHVHAPVSGILTLLAYFLSFRSRRNLVFTVHNSWRSFRLRNRLFLRFILFLFPTVVVCGAAAHQSMPRLLRWLTGPRVSVIANGVDIDRVDLAVAQAGNHGRQSEGFSVVSVNRLIPIKDPWTVLQSFERLREPSAELVFVGDGELRDGLIAGVQVSTARSQVQFTGLIPREQVYWLLSTADVFISPSRGEGLPVAVLEAMACGCPVILSDIPPHREIAAQAPDVRLVRVGDVDGFARALRKLASYEPAWRRELAQRQRRCVTEFFSVRSMNDGYKELYMQLIDNNGGSVGQPLGSNGQPRRSDQDVVGLVGRMRARLGMCIALTLLGALAAYGYSQYQAPEYQATSSLIIGDIVGGPADQDALDASAALAATYADLARREPVLDPIADSGFADSWQDLQPQVHAQVGDKNPQLVQITAVAPTIGEADRLAEAVADQVVTLAEAEQQVGANGGFIEAQMGRLETQITDTQKEIDDAREEADDGTANPEDFAEETKRLEKDLDELQDKYAAFSQLATTAPEGASVAVLEHSYPTQHPLRPDQRTLIVAGAALGLALAAALAYLLGGRRRPVRLSSRPPTRTPQYVEPQFSDIGSPDANELFDDLAGTEPTRSGGRP
ncbi:MAG TPA: glycosyltransferase [Nocardioidaceae bacterium]|nr:glycosyltransferase [Nocardioidaceae bacterium]